MILWRISNHADLLGIGALYASARWHTRGKPVVYLAESSAAALLETLVHLELDEKHRPESYKLLKVEVADTVQVEHVGLEALPANWTSAENITQKLGDEWLERASSALLRVPSAITPETWNWLLNPRHGEESRVRILPTDAHRVIGDCFQSTK